MPAKIPTEKLKREFWRLVIELGHVPTSNDMDKHGEYSSSTYNYRFGSWEETIRHFGLTDEYSPHGPRPQISGSDLLDGLKRLAEELGRTPEQKDMDKLGAHSASTYQNRFGSWNRALQRIGLEPNLQIKITDQELLAELRKVHDEYSGDCDYITSRDMSKSGKYGTDVYIDRFGSWVNALREADLPSPSEEVSCDRCGSKFHRSRARLNRNKRNFCSKECYSKHQSENWVGESHPNWRGGRVKDYGEDWKSIRKEIIKRDGHRCKVCGLTQTEHIQQYGGELHVHHIIPRRQYNNVNEANNQDNLITLCVPHHRKWEGVPLKPLG